MVCRMDKEYPDWKEKAKKRRKKKKLSLGEAPAKKPADIIHEEVEVGTSSRVLPALSGLSRSSGTQTDVPNHLFMKGFL